MKKIEFRALKEDEIDVRVAMCRQNGVSLLLYKDARVDMRILDETFGQFGWKRSHQLIGDRLYCTVEIYDEDNDTWVFKQDVGTESNTEKEKGQASDSFKRACFNVGIGRELYTAPFIWVPNTLCEIQQRDGKWVTFDRFVVEKIDTRDGVIKQISIINETASRKSGQIVRAFVMTEKR